MNDRQGISIAVLSRDQNDVELVNRTLRDAGHAAHCHWVEKPDRFDDTLQREPLELIILNIDNYADNTRQVIKQKEAYLPEIPVIALQRDVDEGHILQAMSDGACDLVSKEKTDRLQAVVTRELRAIRMERALNSTLFAASEYRKQLSNYMHGSNRAIANVQEGIITEVNAAWLQLFAAKNTADMAGLPLMDYFSAASQAAIKGALIATTKGKWQKDDTLLVNASIDGQDAPELELAFQLIRNDAAAFVQIQIAPQEAIVEEPTKLIHEALKRDPTTLFFHRAQFIERITKRLARKPKSGLHLVAYIKIDDFSKIKKHVGHIASEEVIALFAEEVRKRLHPRDVAGRFEGTAIMTLLERGNERDAEVWGRQLIEHMQDQAFKIGKQTVRLTCTVGICSVSAFYASLDELIDAVANACSTGKANGGNCVHVDESSDEDTRQRKYDAIWVKHIKAALLDNRFRLAHLPIAGLRSDSLNMYDMLVRMIDAQGNAVLPSEFLPAAERNDLMKTIDRWMFAASLDYCADHAVDLVFVRLSQHSMQDPSLLDWIQKELRQRNTDGSKICVQIPEQEAAKYLRQTRHALEGLRKLDIKFALEHYGVDRNRLEILDLLRPDYIKIDGELMHSLVADTEMQESVKQLAAAANQRNIQTIAERVENANAMAVLFQLGVHYMQGHYVQEPEVVLQEAVNVTPTTLAAIAGA